MSSDTLRVIEQAILPVSQSYGLGIVGRREDRSYAEVRYAGERVGLAVAVDWGELRPFVKLAHLDGGKFPTPSPLDDVAAPVRHIFDADDLIALRADGPSPVGKMFSARDAASARPLLDEYAIALQKYCSDVLQGDFRVFAQLDDIVQRRSREFYGPA